MSERNIWYANSLWVELVYVSEATNSVSYNLVYDFLLIIDNAKEDQAMSCIIGWYSDGWYRTIMIISFLPNGRFQQQSKNQETPDIPRKSINNSTSFPWHSPNKTPKRLFRVIDVNWMKYHCINIVIACLGAQIWLKRNCFGSVCRRRNETISSKYGIENS